MSDLDAYEDEMRRLSRLNDSELDDVVRGIDPAAGDDAAELATFARELQAGFSAAPDEATASRHLAAIAEASSAAAADDARTAPERRRTGRAGTARRARRARRGLARVGLAVGGLMLCATGLAVAGVRLPEPAASVLEAVGVDAQRQSPAADSGGDRPDQRRPGSHDGDIGAGSGAAPGARSAPRDSAASGRGPGRSSAGAGPNGSAPPTGRPRSPGRSGNGDRARGGRPPDAGQRPARGIAPGTGGPPTERGGPPADRGAGPPAGGRPPATEGRPPSQAPSDPPSQAPAEPPEGTETPGATTPFGGSGNSNGFESGGGRPEGAAGRSGEAS